MAKNRQNETYSSPEVVISIIGPGMRVIGDIETDGTVRVEGTIEGNIRAGKGVVIGKGGLITGDISTQDAVVAGRVVGTLKADSRLELQPSSQVEGEVVARRMQLEEGAVLNGTVKIMADEIKKSAPRFEELAATEPDKAPEVRKFGEA